MRHEGARRGVLAGLAAGLAAVLAMEVAARVAGIRALPDLLQQPLLAVMPGPVFGFLIDNLQHAGKVVEEAGLIATMAVLLAVLGGAAGLAADRLRLPRPGLVTAVVAWLLVVLVALPAGGQGLLGLAAGPTTPLIWALVFVVYWLTWELAWRRPGPAQFDQGRRRLVTVTPIAIGVASLAAVGVLKVPDWIRSVVAPPEARPAGPAPELTPADRFYRVSKNFSDPVVEQAGWTLRVGGLVGRPLKLSYEDLQRIPAATQVITLECISNDVGGDLMSTGRFSGVPLRDLLAMAEARSGATAVNFKARDGYTESLPLSAVTGSPEVMVAHHLDDAPLAPAHGFPARVLIPGRYGMKGPKWLEEITVATSEAGGFWEQQGWDGQAVVRTTSRFDMPAGGTTLALAAIPLAGVAFAGRRGVAAVEWSADGGRSWTRAALRMPLSPFSWALWSATWTPEREGVYTLVVRARDGGGALQTDQPASSFPGGASGYHTIHVTIGR
jgi:DMSO/TMAO reductase YedYZ molybdopterin-dependent catalytic subunit